MNKDLYDKFTLFDLCTVLYKYISLYMYVYTYVDAKKAD